MGYKQTSRKKLERFSAKITYVPNGVNYDFFSGVPKIEKIKKQRPKLGYVGALSAWFDATLIGEIATILSDWDIVLVGPDCLKQEQRALLMKPNIHFVGRLPYEELPVMLATFDVAMIPFIINDLIKSTNPIKLYEYLAAGLPVIATPMPEVVSFIETGVVLCAETSCAFANAVREIIRHEKVSRRQEIAKSYSWEGILQNAMEHILF